MLIPLKTTYLLNDIILLKGLSNQMIGLIALEKLKVTLLQSNSYRIFMPVCVSVYFGISNEINNSFYQK